MCSACLRNINSYSRTIRHVQENLKLTNDDKNYYNEVNAKGELK